MEFRKSFQSLGAGALLVVWGISPSFGQSSQPVYRVHCGGEAFTDAGGKFWDADRLFEGGSTFSVADTILETADQGLYQTERWNNPELGNLRYTFPVPDGKYVVRLHFAEIWDGAFAEGKRVFDVNVNGQPAAQAVDIYTRVGARKPLVLEPQADAVDGKVTVEFANVVNHAKVSGIEIMPAMPFRAVKAPYRIHCGGDDFIDALGNYWEGDGHYTGGSVYTSMTPVSGTDNSLLYQTERFNDPGKGGALIYEFDVEEGSYTVRLHFAEIFFSDAGQRVFGIEVNGTPVESAFDVIAAAGAARTAVVKEYPATAVGGKVRVEFKSQVENAKVSGIEVLTADPTRVRGTALKAAKAPRSGIRSGRWLGIGPSGEARDLRGARR